MTSTTAASRPDRADVTTHFVGVIVRVAEGRKLFSGWFFFFFFFFFFAGWLVGGLVVVETWCLFFLAYRIRLCFVVVVVET